jgi:hypothetical protein
MWLRLSKCEPPPPPLSAGTHFGIRIHFFRAGLDVSLAREAAVSSLHCGEVIETRRVVGETRTARGGGAQVHSLSVTCTLRNLGNIRINFIDPLTTLLR